MMVDCLHCEAILLGNVLLAAADEQTLGRLTVNLLTHEVVGLRVLDVVDAKSLVLERNPYTGSLGKCTIFYNLLSNVCVCV